MRNKSLTGLRIMVKMIKLLIRVHKSLNMKSLILVRVSMALKKWIKSKRSSRRERMLQLIYKINKSLKTKLKRIMKDKIPKISKKSNKEGSRNN